MLGGLGERLIKAGSAREALSQLLKEDIAVVLIDIQMPELDGFELAPVIREHPRFEQTALIQRCLDEDEYVRLSSTAGP